MYNFFQLYVPVVYLVKALGIDCAFVLGNVQFDFT